MLLTRLLTFLPCVLQGVLEFVRATLAMLDVTKSSSLASKLARSRLVAQDLCAPRPSEFSKSRIAILFALLMSIASIPIVLHPLPPIPDYINHLARMHVIATINSDPFPTHST